MRAGYALSRDSSMNHEVLFASILVIPLLAGAGSLVWSSVRNVLRTMLAGVLLECIPLGMLVVEVFTNGPVSGVSHWFNVDALSAYHLAVMMVVYALSSLFAIVYFSDELKKGHLRLGQAKIFAGLWSPSMAAMTLVLISNHLGMMWIGIEGTTLITAFLIRVHLSRSVLEAMWKYMMICSVGIAFAFMGTLLTILSAHALAGSQEDTLLWTNLVAHGKMLDTNLVKGAFIFLVVGYGTKAGLAPMHSWLPDAHSKAPAPVSALFSGFMLNAALYCIMRYIPIADIATGGTGWPLRLLLGFGIVSILVASGFILVQRDLKRLLAYSSVEHLGIIALGLGLGGIGTFAALFHTLNHSLCKTLAFSSAGRLGQIFGSHDMERMAGGIRISRVWGIGLLASLLAVIGVAPFSLFMSEFQILKAAIDRNLLVVVGIFLIGTASVFVGALGHAIAVAWGSPASTVEKRNDSLLEFFLVVVPLVVLIGLGVWMPATLKVALEGASAIIQGTVPVQGVRI